MANTKKQSGALIRQLINETERLSKQNTPLPIDILTKARAELADLEARKIKQ